MVLAWDQGYKQIACDIDCEELVTILDRTDQDLVLHHPQVLVLKEIMTLMARDWRVTVNWVHRDGNAAADWLAKYGHSLLDPGVHVIRQPENELQLLLLKDSLVVS
ncbi:uncharacterized protein LOC130737196 [Lotus japonicus]|uniref:uncharacterized protein LOC130737196 n=1 Tax=Lotus japonicus TaxID=34305 RepID=UPI0025875689|nr:uncharacterized protein LOC130737196 [Lotus japonicus]